MEEKRTAGRDEDSARGRGGQLEENSGMSRGQRGVQQEERTSTTVVNKKGSIYIQNRFFLSINGFLGSLL